MRCPECGSVGPFYKAGVRHLSNGSEVQRYLCRVCGHRFSQSIIKVDVTEKVSEAFHSKKNNGKVRVASRDSSVDEVSDCLPFLFSEDVASHNFSIVEKDLNDLLFYNSKRQVCAQKDAKNLKPQAETKSVAGKYRQPLPQEAKGIIAKYMAYLEREGYSRNNRYVGIIHRLLVLGVNLYDPEDVKAKIACQPWKDSSKMISVYAYDAFTRMEKIQWNKPRYTQPESLFYIPAEKELDALIASANSKRMAAFLKCLKETYADPGEILALRWKDLSGNVAEWVNTWNKAKNKRAAMGGFYFDNINNATCTSNMYYAPQEKRSEIGFRCCK